MLLVLDFGLLPLPSCQKVALTISWSRGTSALVHRRNLQCKRFKWMKASLHVHTHAHTKDVSLWLSFTHLSCLRQPNSERMLRVPTSELLNKKKRQIYQRPNFF